MSRFVTSQLERGNVGPVNLVEVNTFEKFDHLQTPEDEGRYQIKFYFTSNTTGQKEISWKYNTECDRNSDYEALIQSHTQILNKQ
tara:strand:+ start:273 stop:527 length:255 start_codon:yes stop_codon:yes gene_type:complete